jgi:TRAP-type transport system periplasmic protein
MKRNLLSMMLVVGGSLLLSPVVVSAETVTLTYSTFFPPTHIQSITSEEWCKEVEARTEGRVKVQFFPGQTLTKAPQTYEAITDGIADIGTAALAYTQGRFPVMAAMDLPFGYKSGTAATQVANQLFAKMNPEEFAATKVMYFHAHGPGFIHTREKGIQKLEDLKGQRIRSTGMSANVVTALGGTPVSMAMPDTYQSLQKGVVDGSMHPVETNKGWNMGEVVDYVTMAYPSAYTTTFFVVMNKDKWAAIDPADQKIIEEINAAWAAKHGDAWDSSDKDGIAFFQEKGGQIIELDEAETKRWEEAVAPVVNDYAASLDKLNVKGQEVIDFIRTTLNTLQE